MACIWIRMKWFLSSLVSCYTWPNSTSSWMTLTFTEGDRVARKLEPVQSHCCEVSLSSTNIFVGWLYTKKSCTLVNVDYFSICSSFFLLPSWCIFFFSGYLCIWVLWIVFVTGTVNESLFCLWLCQDLNACGFSDEIKIYREKHLGDRKEPKYFVHFMVSGSIWHASNNVCKITRIFCQHFSVRSHRVLSVNICL